MRLIGRDVHAYARNLEEVIIRTLRTFKITSGRKKGYPGVWVGDKKIAAQGIAVSRWVTMHGMAVNVCPEMDHFSLIIPCGLTDFGVVSRRGLLGKKINVDLVSLEMRKQFSDVFDLELNQIELKALRELLHHEATGNP